jgi:hypothetical protein
LIGPFTLPVAKGSDPLCCLLQAARCC